MAGKSAAPARFFTNNQAQFNDKWFTSMGKHNTQLTPLSEETRTALPTSEAARHLNREDQTLRVWASLETGPIKPIRVNGRLHWLTNDIRKLLRVEK